MERNLLFTALPKALGLRLLMALCVVCSVFCAACDSAYMPADRQAAVCSASIDVVPSQDSRQQATIHDARHQPTGEAVLTDANHIYRICSSRPQRLVPNSMQQPKRMAGRQGIHFIINLPSLLSHCGRKLLPSAPFRNGVSCDYYVIALRHIIR